MNSDSRFDFGDVGSLWPEFLRALRISSCGRGSRNGRQGEVTYCASSLWRRNSLPCSSSSPSKLTSSIPLPITEARQAPSTTLPVLSCFHEDVDAFRDVGVSGSEEREKGRELEEEGGEGGASAARAGRRAGREEGERTGRGARASASSEKWEE